MVEKNDNILVSSKLCILSNQGKEWNDLPVASVVTKI